MIDFSVPPAGDLDVVWHAGWPSAKHDPAPEIQVHAYDPHTIILRQNMSVSHEAPFLFLLLGNAGALLIDTGATADPAYFPLRRTVDTLIADWLTDHPRNGYTLTIAHTHGHGDHVAADDQFADRAGTTIIGKSVEDVTAYYGFDHWPSGAATIDLGGRIVDVLPGPGHHRAATVFYDRYTRILFTGDTVYPGRLYVEDWPTFTATIDKLVAFAADHPVTHVLGCHVEMTRTPGHDYMLGATYQPDEHPLQLTVAHLQALQSMLKEGETTTGVSPLGDTTSYPHDDFVIWRL